MRLSPRIRIALRAAAGIGVGAALLWLAFREAPLAEVAGYWRRIEASWLLLGMTLYGVDALLRAGRWHLLLREVHNVVWPRVAQVLVVGYAVNNLLPARLGELFRADYAKRCLGTTRSAALGSIVPERLLDLALVVASIHAGLLLGAVRIARHADTIGAVGLTGTLLLAGGTGVCLLAPRLPGLARRLPSAIGRRVTSLAEGMRCMRLHNIGALAGYSLAIYVLEGLALWACARSMGVALTAAQGMLLLGAASLSTLVPTAPGYVGSYQLVYALVFAAFGHTAAAGIATATVVQVFLLGGLTLAGLGLYTARFAHHLGVTQP